MQRSIRSPVPVVTGKKKMRAKQSPRPHCFQYSKRQLVVLWPYLLDTGEHYQQSKQHERFDQREAENHHRLNTSRCARIPRGAFASSRRHFRLANGAAEHGDGKTDRKSTRLNSSHTDISSMT